jgi:hypothetical protein
LSEIELVPFGVVTVMSAIPAGAGGETAVTELADSGANAVAATPSKRTAVTPTKALPPIVTLVPPAAQPPGRPPERRFSP